MADITVTAAQVAAVFPKDAKIRSFVAGEAITKGQAVYLTTAGLAGVADANAAGKQQCKGIALNGVGAGQAVDVLMEGEAYGFTVSGLNVGALVYLSDTAGALADGAGTMTVVVGRVMALSDKDKTKVLELGQAPTALWS